VNHYLPYFKQQLICHLLSVIYYCRVCLLKDHIKSSSLFLILSPVELLACQLLLQALCSEPSTLSASCPFQFLVYYSVVCCCFLRQGQSVQGATLVYPRGSCGSTTCRLFAYLLVCISQADLELVTGNAEALLVSQCNMAWRSLLWAGGLGCQGFASSWWFFPAKCGSSVSGRFLIYKAHTVCFFPLVSILDPPRAAFN
jgi:hypothetical protein